MQKILIEVCCGSAADVIESAHGGADRVELNSSLFHGGLTPSIGELIVARKNVSIPIMAMVRPREGGFCYTEVEYQTAISDAEMLLQNGADGIVFGFLHEDGSLDVERCAELMQIIGGKTAVFHRAIDVVPDWKQTLDQLIKLGVKRVLTSGQEPNVFFGLDTVHEMIEYVQGAIEILPGAGITLKNAAKVVEQTGCNQIHVAFHKQVFDNSTANNNQIFYGGALYPPEDRYQVADSLAISQLREAL